jgi:16S rRNA (guanine527-N7)-methyltransferase
MTDLQNILAAGLKEISLDLDQPAQNKLLAYIKLLQHWNQIHNLTATRDQKSILIRHLLDSLSIFSYIVGPEILDFGTGAGFPGIPLAIALPQYKFYLLDSSRKKTTFLQHAALTLQINNISVINQRVEEFQYPSGFATIVTRATSDLSSIIDKTKHLRGAASQILVMKGKHPTEELATIGIDTEVFKIVVPFLNEERHLVKILI